VESWTLAGQAKYGCLGDWVSGSAKKRIEIRFNCLSVLSFLNFFFRLKKKKKKKNHKWVWWVTRNTTRLSKINGSTRLSKINGSTHLRPKPVYSKPKPANFVSGSRVVSKLPALLLGALGHPNFFYFFIFCLPFSLNKKIN
jgi:hypothetical protein